MVGGVAAEVPIMQELVVHRRDVVVSLLGGLFGRLDVYHHTAMKRNFCRLWKQLQAGGAKVAEPTAANTEEILLAQAL